MNILFKLLIVCIAFIIAFSFIQPSAWTKQKVPNAPGAPTLKIIPNCPPPNTDIPTLG